MGSGADVAWPDSDAAGQARGWAAAARLGRLGGLADWLAGATGSWPLRELDRQRWVHVGDGETPYRPPGVGFERLDPAAGFDGGVALADRTVDSGADVLLVSGHTTPACLAAVCVLAGAEPVAVLPRGPAAVDSAAWIAQAAWLRDRRPALLPHRDRPDELVTALDDPALAAGTGLVSRAVARRTPVLLDGGLPVAAAMLAFRAQPRAATWWRIVDTSSLGGQAKAIESFGEPPILDTRIETEDGTAGLIALVAVSAAVRSSQPAGGLT